MNKIINLTDVQNKPREPHRFKRRHGSTTYHVTAHFSQTSRETVEDKVIRMMKNEIASGKVVNM